MLYSRDGGQPNDGRLAANDFTKRYKGFIRIITAYRPHVRAVTEILLFKNSLNRKDGYNIQ